MNFYRIFFYFLHKKRKRETNIFRRRQVPCHQRNQSYNCTEWFTWMTLGIGWLSFFSSFPREKEHIMMLLLFSLNHAYNEKRKKETKREEKREQWSVHELMMSSNMITMLRDSKLEEGTEYGAKGMETKNTCTLFFSCICASNWLSGEAG